MKTKELSDDNTSYSTTRYAFVTIIKFDIIVISLSILSFIICHLVGKPLDNSFFINISTLLGIPTALITIGKSLQGFEPSKDKPHRIED